MSNLFTSEPFFKNRFLQYPKAAAKAAIVFLLVISIGLPANAQTLSDAKMAAVMSIINMYLMDQPKPSIPRPDGEGVLIALNELSAETYTVDENLFAEFDLVQESVELCFNIASSDVIPANGIQVEVNGEMRSASIGENCYYIPTYDLRETNYINLIVNQPGITLVVSALELQSLKRTQLRLTKLTRGAWDEPAVRKVLKIFAFGGHATDAQILEWADMQPSDAIIEMLNFDEHNLKLSPLAIGEKYTDSATAHGTLTAWQNFISDEASNIPIPSDRRSGYGLNGSNFDDAYNRMITVRGLNPFRQKIGFWETNYHLATNFDASVSRRQMAKYYDLIMQAHADDLPYHEVMGIAAKSAAIAEQYGHDRNQWRFDNDLGEYACRCNDDFAREIHQLFYGIFGVNDPNHEDVTIPETAKLLTDMPLEDSDGPNDDIVVDFGTDNHHVANVNVLEHSIAGADASAKIDALMPISIEHPESLANLPVMIISVLADDSLSEYYKNQLRVSWASMPVGQKKLLKFIQAYAVSAMFHRNDHIKYLSTHERALYLANKNNLDNLEAYFGGGSYDGRAGRAGRSVGGVISDDNAGDFFRPLHNVFGGQTGSEAADSALVFENHFNTLTDNEDRLRESVQCSTCDLGDPWEKKWKTVLPQRDDGNYYVEDIAPWLWMHAVGSMDNYTELERAHLYSFLGAAQIDLDDDNDGDYAHDFNLVMCVIEDYQFKENATDTPIIDILDDDDSSWDDYCRRSDSEFQAHEIAALTRVYTGSDIAESAAIQNILSQLGQVTLRFNETDGVDNQGLPDGGKNVRKHALERINTALGFIFTTPFVFAEGQ